jgi:hypothetical protein
MSTDAQEPKNDDGSGCGCVIAFALVMAFWLSLFYALEHIDWARIQRDFNNLEKVLEREANK